MFKNLKNKIKTTTFVEQLELLKLITNKTIQNLKFFFVLIGRNFRVGLLYYIILFYVLPQSNVTAELVDFTQ